MSTPTPADMPTKAVRALSKTEERRLRSRTSNRIALLGRTQLREMTGDELLALNEHLDNFFAERNEMRAEADQ